MTIYIPYILSLFYYVSFLYNRLWLLLSSEKHWILSFLSLLCSCGAGTILLVSLDLVCYRSNMPCFYIGFIIYLKKFEIFYYFITF
jgi:hypothetical protein